MTPRLGDIRRIGGTIPHPRGSIGAAYEIEKDGTLEAKVTIPEGVDGTFNWKGGHYVLKSGTNRIRIKAK